jgi:hypothetical protein
MLIHGFYLLYLELVTKRHHKDQEKQNNVLSSVLH